MIYHIISNKINKLFKISRYIIHSNINIDSKEFNWMYSDSSIELAHTPPSIWYTNQLFYEFVEKPITFRDNWLLVGRKDQLSSLGSYICGNITNEPFVIINNPLNGELKAYSNVCRHHAALLCYEGTGKILNNRLVCPYHGWEYDINTGRLAKAMQMKGCKDFTSKDIKLNNYIINTIGPWIFLSFNNTNQSVLTSQPDIKYYINQLEQSNYSELTHIHSKSYYIKCNWKVYIDNYLDGGYHVSIGHPGLSKSLDLSTYQRKRHQHCFIQTCDSNNSNNRVRNGKALYIYHYPNICINRYGDWMDTNVVYPISSNECIVHFDWFVHNSLLRDTKYINECMDSSEQVQIEDINLCERVQKGLESHSYDKGRYSPEFEDGEYMFHQNLYSDYKHALSLYNKI